jgi:hypothetical protein
MGPRVEGASLEEDICTYDKKYEQGKICGCDGGRN